MIKVNKESPWYTPDIDDMVRETNAFKFYMALLKELIGDYENKAYRSCA